MKNSIYAMRSKWPVTLQRKPPAEINPLGRRHCNLIKNQNGEMISRNFLLLVDPDIGPFKIDDFM